MSKIIDEAKDIIEGQRKTDYGDAGDSFSRVAWFWEGYLGKRLEGGLKPIDVANMMILFKVARDAHKPGNRENHVDIIGYAALTDFL